MRQAWKQTVTNLVILLFIMGVVAGMQGQAPAPAPASALPIVTPSDVPKQFTIDNRALVTALAFGQRPNQHVSPIQLDAEGRVFCALPPSEPWLPPYTGVVFGVLLAMGATWWATARMARRERERMGQTRS